MPSKGAIRIIIAVLAISKNLNALLIRHRCPTASSRLSRPHNFHYGLYSTLRSLSSEHIETKELFQPRIPILYESDRILIIDKPPGIAHHDDENGNPGIISLIRNQQQQRLWGVHRLDRVTSGILILAKDAVMASLLSNLFAEGKIQKVYVGISAKRKPKKKQGWVQGSMSRSRDKSWKLNRDDRKNFAKTRFFTAKVFDGEESSKCTCILFRPYTGRTHQLRVAAKSVGLALLGDPIYKDGQDSSVMNPFRTYLHATGICIPELGEDQDSISLWHPPSFEDLFEDKEALKSVLDKLMKKYCDVGGIVDAKVRHDRSTQGAV